MKLLLAFFTLLLIFLYGCTSISGEALNAPQNLEPQIIKDTRGIEANAPTTRCTDSDVTPNYPDGINPYVRGDTVVEIQGKASGLFSDNCIENLTLKEYFCEQNNANSTEISCENEYACDSGECIEIPSFCGNGVCEPDENSTTCPGDCPGKLYSFSVAFESFNVIDASSPHSPDGISEIVCCTDPEIPFMKESPESIFANKIDDNYFAYFINRAVQTDPPSFNVVNISDPFFPDGIAYDTNSDPKIDSMDYPNSLFVKDNYAYVVSGKLFTKNMPSSLVVIDISNPADPDGIGQVTNADPQIRDMNAPTIVFVKGNYAYVVGREYGTPLGTGRSTLSVIDISNPFSPDGIAQLTKADPDIFLTYDPTSLFISGNYAYLIHYDFAALTVIDVSNPASPDGITTFSFLLDPDINKLVKPTSVFVSGNYAYVTADGPLQPNGDFPGVFGIIDISDPSHPDGIAQIMNTITNTDPDIPDFRLPASDRGIYVKDNFAYVLSRSTKGALIVFDVSNPLMPDGVGQVTNADPEILNFTSPEGFYLMEYN